MLAILVVIAALFAALLTPSADPEVAETDRLREHLHTANWPRREHRG